MCDPIKCNTITASDDLRDTHRLKISRLENAFKVTSGCKVFAFETLPRLLKFIEMFYTDPIETEKKYCRKEGLHK
jgi:hypothetical protein